MLIQRVAAMLIACSMLLNAAGRKQESPESKWAVKYKSGSFDLKPGQWLRAEFMTRGASRNMTPSITISGEQVVGVYFSAKAEQESDLLQSRPRSGCGYALNQMPINSADPKPDLLVVVPLSQGPISRATERLNSRNPVQLAWNDAGIEKSVVLTVNQCEYASFIANLRRFVGNHWDDVRRELLR